jgi:hypothetical protein
MKVGAQQAAIPAQFALGRVDSGGGAFYLPAGSNCPIV